MCNTTKVTSNFDVTLFKGSLNDIELNIKPKRF